MASLPLKPRLRGVSHQIASLVAVVPSIALLAVAPTGRAEIAGAIYVVSLIGALAISGLYHTRSWGPAGEKWMRRLDHASIFVLIAGTYTPFCLLALDAASGRSLFALAWGGAALGVARAAFWVNAPRAIIAGGYLFLGWCVVPWFPQVVAALEGQSIGLMITGGALYSVGALVYVFEWPNPAPRVFGFHEVFHVFVVLANVCFFVVMSGLIAA